MLKRNQDQLVWKFSASGKAKDAKIKKRLLKEVQFHYMSFPYINYHFYLVVKFRLYVWSLFDIKVESNWGGVPFISTSAVNFKLFETTLFQIVQVQTYHRKRSPIKQASVYPAVPCVVGVSFNSKQISYMCEINTSLNRWGNLEEIFNSIAKKEPRFLNIRPR